MSDWNSADLQDERREREKNMAKKDVEQGPIDLGDFAEDVITGFKGIVISVQRHINGCNRLIIQPRELNKEGNMVDPYWFDESQLKLIKKGVIPVAPDEERVTGGPPTRASR